MKASTFPLEPGRNNLQPCTRQRSAGAGSQVCAGVTLASREYEVSIVREADDDRSLQQSAGQLVRLLPGCPSLLSFIVLRGNVHRDTAELEEGDGL